MQFFLASEKQEFSDVKFPRMLKRMDLPPAELAPPPVSELAALTARTREFLAAAKAASTRRAYRSDWSHFESWCRGHGVTAMPAAPETVALYLTDLAASHRPGTIRRRLTVIGGVHESAGHETQMTIHHPVVKETLKGIRRAIGTRQNGKRPLYTEQVRAMIRALPENLQGLRDRALLLVGFAGGFRRSELAALTMDRIRRQEEGLVILLDRSKTDPEGQGREVAVPYGSHPQTCPVRALEEWIGAVAIAGGPVFREIDRHGRVGAKALHKDSVGLIVKRAAARIGLNTAEYAGHSLRAGLATQAYRNGANELAIMQQTGHRSLATVRKYIREASLFRENAAGKLGL
jgi:site-specific recombinase XerD